MYFSPFRLGAGGGDIFGGLLGGGGAGAGKNRNHSHLSNSQIILLIAECHQKHRNWFN